MRRRAVRFALVLGLVASAMALYFFTPASAVLVTIDGAVDVTQSQHLGTSPTTVFTSTEVGYKFYVDGNNTCVYSKTTNGGDSWGGAVTVDSQADCIRVAVWYDQWTPGDDSGTYIHIATIDTSEDDIWYTRLDTADDSRSTTVNITSGSTYVGTLTNTVGMPTITKSTTGDLFAAVSDTSDSIVVTCSSTCTTNTNWSESSPTFALGDDYPILLPLLSGAVMLIQWDISADDVQSKVRSSGGTWDANWTNIEINAADNTTYDGGIGAVVDKNTGTVYLAFVDDSSTLGTDDDIKTFRYTGSWSATADVVTNSACAGGTTCGITGVNIGRDNYSGDLYVLYSARSTSGTATTGNVYYKYSTTSMATWSTEQGPLDTSNDDMYGSRISLYGPRLYASWVAITADVLYGNTVLLPTLTVSTTSTQTANIAIGSTGEYVGGAFVLTHNTSSTTVTQIEITETGTVDAQAYLDNIELYYDLDTSAPYDCASEFYGVGDAQFGVTDTDGFSSANGTSTFNGTLSVATSSVACFYAVLDVLAGAGDGDTIDIEITDSSTDVVVSRGVVAPDTVEALGGSTTLQTDVLTQVHFHWRNDDGSEALATSATGGVEDTAYSTYPTNGSKRLRLGISNEGSVTSGSTAYRLEYGMLDTACADVVSWTDVGAAGGDWDMVNSGNLTDGADTTDVAEALGGVSDENSSFLTPNGGVKDTSSQTAGITLDATEYVDLEYSIIASTTAVSGQSYCFRVSNAGTPLAAYDTYARATIAADVLVSVVGTQPASASIPSTDLPLDAAFVLREFTAPRNVTSITITENGTVDAQSDLDNIRLRYELDTSAPYDCESESYAGGESSFGSTDTDGFSSTDGTSTFTGSVGISTTATMCVYVLLDVLSGAANGETIEVEISDSTTDVVVDGGGTTSPTAPRILPGTTTLQAPLLTQTHYHFRNDDGSEALATSATGGVEDTPLLGLNKNETIRVRLDVSNEGLADSTAAYTLEYGALSTTCDAIGTWIAVGDAGGAFAMSDSFNLTDSADTTDISESLGGITNESSGFESPNGAVRDTSSVTGSIVLSADEFAELEYAIEATDAATYGGSYCFRVVAGGSPLYDYNGYPQLTLETERDFFVQRGVTVIASGNTTETITAGVDYTAPLSGSSAFIRITNTQFTGAGRDVGGGNQNALNVTAHMQNPENLQTSVTFARTGATDNTRIYWEIVEYVGPAGGDNEMIVRMATTTTFGTTDLAATTSVSGITDDADVVVFVNAASTPDAGAADYNTMLVTSDWVGATDEAVLTRGEASGDAISVSWAAVEFTGSNWRIQRAPEHTYTTAGVEEFETISAVNDLSRAFLHVQKRSGAALQGMDEFGHEVFLNSTTQISYMIQSGATTPSGQVTVVWVIENTQTTGTPMLVTRSSGTQSGGTEPNSSNVDITATIASLSTASIFTNNRASGTGTAYPRPIMAVRLVSTTQYEIWLSDTGNARAYRTEVVEWPTAERTLTQNHYRFYVDNDALDPSDPWPPGGTNLGENTSITITDSPIAPSENIRIRMSVTVMGANLTASTTAFKLQYGERETPSCTAITEWYDVGDVGSTTALWRGHDGTPADGTALSSNPPSVGDLNMPSVSERAGSYVESGASPGNPYKVFIGEDVEYDWNVERHLAADLTVYCFRMVEYDGSPLTAYAYHPTALTSGFSVETAAWRWYDDEGNETPTSALALENVAPTNVAFDNVVKLRVTAAEVGNAAGTNVKFKLQYSEVSDFSSGVFDVVETGSCTIPTSQWCYADGAGVDNATTTSTVLSDSDACAATVGDGCGSHNESGLAGGTFSQNALAATEYEFTIHHAGADINTVYFFRLYDVTNDAAAATSGTYPSLTTEGAALTYTVDGIAAATATEGITTDITTTATEIAFGTLTHGAEYEAAQRLTVTTNATVGYRVFAFGRQGFLGGGAEILPVTGTNAAPVSWSTGCAGAGCFGYHAGDDVLQGSSARFAPNDTYAELSSSLAEVAFNGVPLANDVNDIVYKVEIQPDQPGGHYSTDVVYIVVPVF